MKRQAGTTFFSFRKTNFTEIEKRRLIFTEIETEVAINLGDHVTGKKKKIDCTRM